MPRVPQSYATMVAEVETEEEFRSAHDLRDEGTATLTAVVSATEIRGYVDAAEIDFAGQVTSVNSKSHVDAATVTMIGVPSGSDGKTWSDAATVLLVGVPSGADGGHGNVDAATASMVGVPSATDALTHNYVEVGLVKLRSRVSGIDGQGYTDAGIALSIGVPSGTDLKARGYVDTDTALILGIASSVNTIQGVDAATATAVGIASGDDILGHTDAATVTMTGVPSGVDGLEWSDSATVTLTSVPSGLDSREWSDAATATLIGVPSGVDEQTLEDAATVTLVGVASGVEEYTQPPAHANETYIFAWGSSADGSSDQGDGGDAGGGSTWNVEKVSAARAGMGASTNENAHSITDLPVRWQDYIFFGSAPTNGYGYFFAVGDAGSVGVKTTGAPTNPPTNTGTSATATTAGYNLPDKPTIGDLVLVFVTVRGSQTAATPTDSSGAPYTLVFSGTSPGGVTNYLWKRVSVANDGAFVISSVLSGSADWYIGAIILDTPSSTTVYKMYEGAMVTSGSIRNTLTANAH